MRVYPAASTVLLEMIHPPPVVGLPSRWPNRLFGRVTVTVVSRWERTKDWNAKRGEEAGEGGRHCGQGAADHGAGERAKRECEQGVRDGDNTTLAEVRGADAITEEAIEGE